MSPNVGNFVHDLVEMAKAMEELPGVREELIRVSNMNQAQADVIASREESILKLKSEIDTLNSKIRDVEVARDDAEMRFLELDEKAGKVVNMLNSIGSLTHDAAMTIAPLPPVPAPEPEPITSGGEGVMGQPSNLVATWPASEAPQGQSESHPTAATTETLTGDNALQIGASENADVVAGITDKPYSGKFYYDHPVYVSLSNWLDGGGSEENYYRSKPRNYSPASDHNPPAF